MARQLRRHLDGAGLVTSENRNDASPLAPLEKQAGQQARPGNALTAAFFSNG